MEKAKKQIVIMLSVALAVLILHGALVMYIDPFFHYHAPLKDYYYGRSERVERYVNDGVARHFDYDSIITGISVSTGFSTSEFDELFDVHSEKIIYSGGTYKETGEGIEQVLRSHPETRIVFCSFFLTKLLQDKNHRRSDITDFPTYLYNANPFDDVEYLFNKDVSFLYIDKILEEKREGRVGGGESLDIEGYLHKEEGAREYLDPELVWEDRERTIGETTQIPISDEEIRMVQGNVQQNILRAAQKYPDTRFIYFVPPVSILFYRDLYEEGELQKTLQAEAVAMQMLIEQPNIELYSFNDHTEIIEDLTNYSDTVHYGKWINTYILKSIAEGSGRITKENLEEYLNNEMEYFSERVLSF